MTNAKYSKLYALVKVLMEEKALLSVLVVFAIGLALSEGISVGLLVPLLSADNPSSALNTIPVIGDLLKYINDIPADRRMIMVAVFLAFAVVGRGTAQFGAQYMASILRLRVQQRLLNRIYARMTAADVSFIVRHDSGTLRNLLNEQTQRAGGAVQSTADIIIALFTIALYAGFLIVISWQMTLAAMVFIGLGYLLMKVLGRSWFAWSGERLSAAHSKLHSVVNETLLGVVLIKLRNADPFMNKRYASGVDDLVHVERRRSFFLELQNPAFMSATGLFICILLIMGSYIYGTEDRSWVGLFLLFVISLYRMMGPATRLVTSQAQIASNLHAFDAIETFMHEAETSQMADGTIPFKGLEDGVRFEGVSLTYDENRGAALGDVSLEIKTGQMLALVGASGSGKSTLVSLLMRLRDPSHGRVLINGTDMREYAVASWRRKISAVSQDVVVFNDTVRNNLIFGLEDVSDDDVWQALRIAEAESFVRDMPHGLDEKLGEGGGAVSGGQRQRLALARAILSAPEILVLDEATSQLDSITEAAIQRAVLDMKHKQTVIIVAHRLSTIRHADKIVVMDKGKIAEMGTHAELYACNGKYRHLFDTQQLGITDDESGRATDAPHSLA